MNRLIVVFAICFSVFTLRATAQEAGRVAQIKATCLQDENTVIGSCLDEKALLYAFSYDLKTKQFTLLGKIPGPPQGASRDYIVGFAPDIDLARTPEEKKAAQYSLKLRSFIFDRKTNTWTILEKPGSRGTYARDVSEDGTIVGSYSVVTVEGTTEHGFIYKDEQWETVDMPKATSTCVRAIDPTGKFLAGNYTDETRSWGFIYNRKTKEWIPIKVEGSVSTVATGVSGDKATGNFRDNDGNARGFIYDLKKKTFFQIKMKDALHTWPLKIFGKTVIGSYDKSEGLNFKCTDGKRCEPLEIPGK